MLSEAAGYPTASSVRRRLYAIGAALLLVVLVGWFLSQHLSLTTSQPAHVRPSTPGPAAAYPRTEAGAVGAATFYLTTINGQLLLDPDKLGAFENRAGSGQYASQLIKDSQDAGDRMESTFGLRAAKQKGATVVLQPQPLAYKVTSEWNGWSVSVAMWWIELVAIDGAAPTQAFWQTATLSLVWEGGSWRISNAQSDVGPAPGGDNNALPDQLRGFQRYRYVV
jgi:hypothetical protein